MPFIIRRHHHGIIHIRTCRAFKRWANMKAGKAFKRGAGHFPKLRMALEEKLPNKPHHHTNGHQPSAGKQAHFCVRGG